MGYAKGELTRFEIIINAISLFSQKGFYNTSFQNIADQCGLSPSAVFHHFPTKLSLLSGCITFIVESNREMLLTSFGEKDSIRIRFEKIFIGNYEWIRLKPEQASLFVLVFYQATVSEEMRKLNNAIHDANISLMQELLMSYYQIEKISHGSICEIQALIVHDFLAGSLLRLAVDREELGKKDYNIYLNEVKILLDGIFGKTN